MKKWNEFLAACSVAWATEGQKEQEVHSFLRRCEKRPSDTPLKIAAKAYKLYTGEQITLVQS